MYQDATWYGGSLDSDDIVLHEDPAPTRHKRGTAPPQFSAHFYCGQTAGCIKMPLGMEVGLSPDNFVVDGDPAAPRLRDTVLDGDPPKMPLGMEVFLGPGDIVFDGDPATPRKRANSWMHQDAPWYGGRSQPRQLCGRWGPSPSPQKGAEPEPPILGPGLLWSDGCMDQDATWYRGRPRPR